MHKCEKIVMAVNDVTPLNIFFTSFTCFLKYRTAKLNKVKLICTKFGDNHYDFPPNLVEQLVIIYVSHKLIRFYA